MSNVPPPKDSDTDAKKNANQVHLIVQGETLSKIAVRYNLSLHDLLAANPQITNKDLVMAGQRVTIPFPAAVSPAPATPTADAPAPSLSVPSGLPKTGSLSDAQKFDLYTTYFQQHGVNLNTLDRGHRAILGLRVKSNTHVNQGRGEYNDRMIVAWLSADGSKNVKEFTANTEPSARYEDTPENRQIRPAKITKADGNKDGRGDLGCLPDGLFFYKRDQSSTYGSILRPIQDIYVVRDVDHDGDFDENDNKASVHEALNSQRSILFHKGGADFTGSSGCQTMRREDFDRFWASLGPQDQFQYVLVTV